LLRRPLLRAERKSHAEKETGMSDKGNKDNPFNVLFLCTGNSARSIMAEAIMNRVGAPKFRAFSAGSQARAEVHPRTIALLKSLNYQTDGFRSKNWEEFAQAGAPQLDFVFTVCDNAANEVCPVWPGQPMSAHWGVPDPAAAEGSEVVVGQTFADVYRMLQNRITIFTNLPIASLDKLSLQKRIDGIGRMGRDPSAEGAA
jgi:arsenate reductase